MCCGWFSEQSSDAKEQPCRESLLMPVAGLFSQGSSLLSCLSLTVAVANLAAARLTARMDTPTPPPLPTSPPQLPTSVRPASSFPGQAATFSVVAPFVAIGISIFLQPQVRGNRWAMMILGAASMLLIVLGLVFGIVWLWSAPSVTGGRASSARLWRALASAGRSRCSCSSAFRD